MNTQLDYVVRSCVAEEFTVQGTVDGRTTFVKIAGVALEMESRDSAMGHTFRFVPDDIDAAIAAYPVGASVTVTLSPAE